MKRQLFAWMTGRGITEDSDSSFYSSSSSNSCSFSDVIWADNDNDYRLTSTSITPWNFLSCSSDTESWCSATYISALQTGFETYLSIMCAWTVRTQLEIWIIQSSARRPRLQMELRYAWRKSLHTHLRIQIASAIRCRSRMRGSS